MRANINPPLADRYFTSVRDNVLRALYWSRLESKLLRKANRLAQGALPLAAVLPKTTRNQRLRRQIRLQDRIHNLRVQADVANKHSDQCAEQARRLLREANAMLRYTHVTMVYTEARQCDASPSEF